MKDKNESLKRMQETTGDDNLSFIELDDTFGFKCQQCGKCCMNRNDIILNPFDIYNGSKYLGIKPEEFLKKYCFVDFGAYSKIPMVLLKSGDNGFCPLLKYDVKDGGKFKCIIHQAKPSACANHPIGVVYSRDLSDGKEETTYIKTSQCLNSVSDEQQKVRDWLKTYLDNQEEIKVAHHIQHLVTQYIDPRKYWTLLTFLHDKVGNVVELVMSKYTACSIGLGYVEYDINKPFVEQAEANIKELIKFYEKTKELYEILSKSVEEIVGKSFDEIFEEIEKEGKITDGNDDKCN